MSAIAGFIRHPDAAGANPQHAPSLLDCIAPYGQDLLSHYVSGECLLVRGLLFTTPEHRLEQHADLDPGAGDVLLLDGRVDNREDIADALGLDRHTLPTLSDTALLKRALRTWQADALPRIVGDFALVYWQPGTGDILLARDPIGSRPLFWRLDEQGLHFGSLAKAVAISADLPGEPDADEFAAYLCYALPEGTHSYYAGIQRIEPGHRVSVRNRHAVHSRYHDFRHGRAVRFSDPRDYVLALEEKLAIATTSLLRATGPVSSHLSSGLDSATVSVIAARQLARQGRTLNVFTTSSMPSEGETLLSGYHADELTPAREVVAMHANMHHHVVMPPRGMDLQLIREGIRRADEPLFNICNFEWMAGIDFAVRDIGSRVLLTGGAGNISISYTGERLLHHLLRSGSIRAWLREGKLVRHRQPARRWRGLLLESCMPWIPQWLFPALGWLQNNALMQPTFPLAQAWQARLPDLLRRHPLGSGYRSRDSRDNRIAALFSTEGGNFNLSAGARGVEYRDPTADRRVLEYCLNLPESAFMQQGEQRYLVRELMRHELPSSILYSPTKGLQSADWQSRLLASRDELLQCLDEIARHPLAHELMDIPKLRRDLENCQHTTMTPAEAHDLYRGALFKSISAGIMLTSMRA